MVLECCDVFWAIAICSIVTIVFYLISLVQSNNQSNTNQSTRLSSFADSKRIPQKEEPSQERALSGKLPSTTNIQGLENNSTPIQSDPCKVIHVEQHIVDSSQAIVASEILVNESADITRLQNEDLLARVDSDPSSATSIGDDYIKIDRNYLLNEMNQDTMPQISVGSDGDVGRIQLRIQYNESLGQLSVQILDFNGIIHRSQTYAPEALVEFALIGREQNDEEPIKQQRIIVENSPVSWKEPIHFNVEFDLVKRQNLYVLIKNDSDPQAPNDREVMHFFFLKMKLIDEGYSSRFFPYRFQFR